MATGAGQNLRKQWNILPDSMSKLAAQRAEQAEYGRIRIRIVAAELNLS